MRFISRSKKILVADDDPIYADVAKDALEKAGHTVLTARDGGEALDMLASQHFDAAIVDLTMPVADGLTVIRTLRTSSRNAEIPLIVITGHDDAEAVDKAYRAGATSFLTKPLNWVLFTPHIEFVLRSGAVEAALRETSATNAFLSDLKSQVMEALANEFQGPIKTIFGFSELIGKQVYGPLEPAPYAEMAGDMARSARALNTSLLKLMDFGRTLAESLHVAKNEIRVRDAISHAIDELAVEADRRQINLKADIDIAPSVVMTVDRVLLHQALRGILDHALRATPRGEEVVLSARLSPEGDLVMSSRDRGPAMPAMLVAEINDKRTQRSALAAQEQRDVSMKIAKILIEAHQGRLNVTTHPSGGNLIEVKIPSGRLASSAATATATPANATAPISASPPAIATVNSERERLLPPATPSERPGSLPAATQTPLVAPVSAEPDSVLAQRLASIGAELSLAHEPQLEARRRAALSPAAARLEASSAAPGGAFDPNQPRRNWKA